MIFVAATAMTHKRTHNMVAQLKVGSKVADKKNGDVLGVIKRFVGTDALVLADGSVIPRRLKATKLIAIKVGQPAQASAPAQAPKDSTLRDMTTMIQVKVTGTIRGQNWDVITRQFKTVNDAADYLAELKVVDVDGRNAKVVPPAEAEVFANYDISLILAGKAPKGPLPVIIQSISERKLIMPHNAINSDAGAPPPISSAIGRAPSAAKAASEAPVSRGAMKSSSLVPLKAICRDINLEPREARMKLRSLSKKPGVLPVAHAAQGRWEWEPAQVDVVKALLSGAPASAPKAEASKTTTSVAALGAVKAAERGTKREAAIAKGNKALKDEATEVVAELPAKSKKALGKAFNAATLAMAKKTAKVIAKRNVAKKGGK